MEMTINLAGTAITIGFSGEAEKAITLCNLLFRDFLCPDRKGDAKIQVNIFTAEMDDRPAVMDRDSVFEKLIPSWEAQKCLKIYSGPLADFPINKQTICSSCQDGLLLFNPGNLTGCIFFSKQAAFNLHAFYRLLWLYFAQVLGENGGCFLHAAALTENGEGYLFLGDSGAGKSTIAGLCLKRLVLSDDSPIFFRHSGKYRVYPSPYHQMGFVKGLDQEIFKANVRVRELFFLIKDKRIFSGIISAKNAFSVIMKRHIHFFPFLSAQAKSAMFDLFFDMCHSVPMHNLHFRRDQDVWPVITGGQSRRQP